ncbi:uncharacterized protein LOC106074853 isoform X2 [Biomphalaria glabrata]|uniref:Uncharacterized protein LOC106074853 isoform X2 n=1 Tax=Biomphalaria glabrata TaxID=6526 RepID=A0A9W2ZCG4_BIOGL|nr:uncharacterized protein LOC106074853 isoform X2 [Biomphalaria glabrata]
MTIVVLCFFLGSFFLNPMLVCAGEYRSATLGHHYILSLPSVPENEHSQVVFYLVTFITRDFKVKLTTEGYKDGPSLDLELELDAKILTSHVLARKYYFHHDTGPKWVFRFQGLSDFGLTVLLQANSDSVATFIALPDSSWGKEYFAVTLETSPFILIMTSGNSTLVKVKLRISALRGRVNLNLNYQGVNYKDGDSWTIILNRFEAFEISECSKPEERGNLSGSKITAQRPVGVISGSCTSAAYEPDTKCDLEPNEPNTDFSAEMIVPLGVFDMSYTAPTSHERKIQGLTLIISSNKKSNIIYYTNPLGITSSSRIDSEEPTYKSNLVNIRGTKPFLMYNIQLSACSKDGPGEKEHELGGPSLSVVIPSELYHSEYITCTPYVKGALHYIILATKSSHTETIEIDEDPIPHYAKYVSVLNTVDDVVGSVNITAGIHIVHSERGHAFGCYVYGHGFHFSYMHAAGYKSKNIDQTCIRPVVKMQPEDNIDNDCDGRVDEERKDNQDNDGDGEIDEDLKSPNAKSSDKLPKGRWLKWSSWKCTFNCNDTRLIRTRVCAPTLSSKTPICQGKSLEFKPGVCYYRQTCPAACPDYTWGADCRLTCKYCLEPCNKFDGSCSGCIPGFKNPNAGCRYQCDKFYFGTNCTGSCITECGGDCYERITGSCYTSGLPLLIIFTVTTLLIPCCCCRNFRSSEKKTDEEGATSSACHDH